jgi:hypothetical protein
MGTYEVQWLASIAVQCVSFANQHVLTTAGVMHMHDSK